ncbi:methionine adenosyltransferase [Candidatus Cryosericum odellii]|jgi:S-adenosylmethionine synthetase|uniref:S-adenosylmethionine synthase n=1 Tax=Candidatus Cryosericum odellii TaxID=2290917 RepID=A0A398CXR7_9BACT|nr:methionine adenosyltransferase [Candidatus Cryosericum odellii]RIE06847.1 methionine adenosyltransferase [Candidatus Cryosericum odellii]RIE07582.1 methionine adenosyltransferase [Candidatus Cryosericum odellii]
MERKHLFTSEAVTEGHPDKVADAISDAIVDAYLEQDPYAHVAVETMMQGTLAIVSGEVAAQPGVSVPVDQIVRDTARRIGYNRDEYGFNADTCHVMVAIDRQSSDIKQGVDTALECREPGGDEITDVLEQTGAGDQGFMFGFACDETPVLMPFPAYMANKLARRLAQVRKDGTLTYLRPDGKTQVTVEYEGGTPLRVTAVVVSAQHDPDVTHEQIVRDMIEHVIRPVIPAAMLDAETKYYINPTGRFVIGGPAADTGLTGRKIIVDTYGGMGRHGGGAFSGKDPTKVDRSAAMAARYCAKNVVASGLATRCEVQVAYAIGVACPLSVYVDTFGTSTVDEEMIEKALAQLVDLRPEAIIRHFNLRRPIYSDIACYGAFGRDDLDLSWEQTDIADKLRSLVGQCQAVV